MFHRECLLTSKRLHTKLSHKRELPTAIARDPVVEQSGILERLKKYKNTVNEDNGCPDRDPNQAPQK
jgi:hypothetical protein